ncbi:MAG: 7-cyano-7-deazaguanine synthase QueC [Syntrophomonadaceae bacterium]|nr:7-cyano-7-deazaguanine synthase QueC [Syntrophomonadaceae bacterium]MDD3023010.1 7-cyano-7-deazaguanine synthase QueC [Syntrophomonadaceae bacterium]
MKAVTLLSGGLDSVTSMLLAQRDIKIILALTIDYGQRARFNEIQVSSKLCEMHAIKHMVVRLPFMLDIQSGLLEGSGMNIDSPWVPNRNGLFINLAAAYAESLGAEYVICGFNAEEAIDFPDNSAEYVGSLNQALEYSTLNHVKVISYVQDMNKLEIIKTALTLGIDLNSLWSCYEGGEHPCGKCPSCIRTKEALKKVGIK